MERIIKISPAFDKRHKNPKENYGIGCCKMWFILKGKEGAVQFMLGTGWFLPETVKEYKIRGTDLFEDYPNGWDIGYHSPYPQYEGQKSFTDNCEFLDGKKCYYDGSGLRAEPIMERVLREGHKAIWEELEKEYNFRFKKETEDGNKKSTSKF